MNLYQHNHFYSQCCKVFLCVSNKITAKTVFCKETIYLATLLIIFNNLKNIIQPAVAVSSIYVLLGGKLLFPESYIDVMQIPRTLSKFSNNKFSENLLKRFQLLYEPYARYLILSCCFFLLSNRCQFIWLRRVCLRANSDYSLSYLVVIYRLV